MLELGIQKTAAGVRNRRVPRKQSQINLTMFRRSNFFCRVRRYRPARAESSEEPEEVLADTKLKVRGRYRRRKSKSVPVTGVRAVSSAGTVRF